MLFDQRIVRFGEGILPQWPQHRLSKTVLLMTPHLASRLASLFGTYLMNWPVCWCHPQPHHVQVYLKWLIFSSPERIFTFVRCTGVRSMAIQNEQKNKHSSKGWLMYMVHIVSWCNLEMIEAIWSHQCCLLLYCLLVWHVDRTPLPVPWLCSAARVCRVVWLLVGLPGHQSNTSFQGSNTPFLP